MSPPTMPMSAPRLPRSIPRSAARSPRCAVDDTKQVRKGDVLVVIDDSDTKLALARAQADYQHTLQRVSQYYAQRAAAVATVQARVSDVMRTSGDYLRRQNLAESGAISREQLANARSAAETAEANLVGRPRKPAGPERNGQRRQHHRSSRNRRRPRGAGKGAAGSVAHHDPRADRRRRGAAQGAGRPKRAARPAADDRGPAGPGLCRRQLQGRPARRCARRPAGGTDVGPLRRATSSITAGSPAWAAAPARPSR